MTSQVPTYDGCRFPPEIISHAIWLYPSGNGVSGSAQLTLDVFGAAAVG